MSYVQPSERTGNYVLDHWNGAQPLAQSYWINGSLAGVLASVVASSALAWLNQSGASLQVISASVVTATGLLLFVTLWSAVGIWRSASRHVERGGTFGWANAAKAMMALGVLGLVGQASNLAKSNAEFAQLAMNSDPLGPPANVSVANGLLRIDGTLSLGTAGAVATAMASDPNIGIVQINSRGGRMGEANEIARLIQEREADTVAGAECMSACTVVLLAGLNRASVGGSVGFHQATFPGFSAAELAEMNSSLRQSYVDAGLPRSFIDQALAHGADDMWFPSEPELFEAGILNDITPERIIEDNKESARSINAKAPTIINDLISLVSGKASAMTLTFTYKAKVDRSNIDLSRAAAQLKKDAQSDICSRKMAPIMLRSGAIYEHEYLDQNGALLTRYQITGCDASG